jgi:hypothetical protein
MKNFIKLFITPILRHYNFKEYLNSIIREKDKINFENSFYKRHAFINKAIMTKRDCKYLEIGVHNNDVFNSIPLTLINKIGVDPIKGGTHRMTSDDFFKKNNIKFDVIFIDGLHEYVQCQKDVINSLNCLNENGIILLHDLIPKNSFEASVPQKQSAWTGDVWKVAVELNRSKNIDFKIANIDHGVGICKIKKNAEYIKFSELKNLEFNDFYNYYYKDLPIISSEEALSFIS